MNKKKCIALCCSCLFLSGCSIGTSVDSMLKPPSLSAEQQEIYLALQDAVGNGITLQYPRSGENLSAFTVKDLDGDGADEALVFYKKTGVTSAENVLRFSVLDQMEGDGWSAVYDCPADGTEMERVAVSDMDGRNYIFIGYSNADQSDKALSVYQYGDNGLETLMSVGYTMFDVADTDNDGDNELLVLNRATENEDAKAGVYVVTESGMRTKSAVKLRETFSDFSQVLYGTLKDGSRGIYIDGAVGSSTIQTTVLRMNEEGKLEFVLSDIDIEGKTARSVSLNALDVDGDGVIEIPTQEPFPGYDKSETEQVKLTRWYDVEFSTLKEWGRGYYSVSDAVAFILPQSWYGKVTAKTDTLTGDIIFCQYDKEIEEDMPELLRYGVVQDMEEQETRISEGYCMIRSRGKACYDILVKDSSEELNLSEQEAIARFIFL